MSISGNAASPRGELVYSELLRAINTLEMSPGTQLVESRVAETMGVSRTPVRQALHQLELEGLIEQGVGRSYVVRGLTLQDVNEICDLLEVLDGYVMRAAMRSLSAEEASALIGLTRRMKEAAADRDADAWGVADKDFHDIIQGAANNQLVATLLGKTRARIHKFWANSVNQDRLQKCSIEHEQIAIAIRDKNEALAMALVSEHIQHMRASLTDILERAAAFLPRPYGRPLG